MQAAAQTTGAKGLVRKLRQLKRTFDMVRKAARPSAAQLQTIVRDSFAATTRDGTTPFCKTLNEVGLNTEEWFNNKAIMDVDKLSAYHRIPDDIVHKACQKGSRALFSNIMVDCITPYKRKNSTVALKSTTTHCYVHAEVQLIVRYMLSTTTPITPRVIGSSKGACLLCHLFIRSHAGFVVTGVHGRLYDQWTIPDLAEYTAEDVARLRFIIKQMHAECLRLTKVSKPHPYPLESRHNLRSWVRSPVSSIPDINSLGVGQLQIPDEQTQQMRACSDGPSNSLTSQLNRADKDRLNTSSMQEITGDASESAPQTGFSH